MDRVLSKYKIEKYHVFNRINKCAIAERVIQTLKRKIYKRFTHQNTSDYISTLQKIVDTYNNTPHRGLLFKTPNFVDEMTDEMKISIHANDQYLQKIKNYGVHKPSKRSLTLSQKDILEEGTYVRLLTTWAEG